MSIMIERLEGMVNRYHEITEMMMIVIPLALIASGKHMVILKRSSEYFVIGL